MAPRSLLLVLALCMAGAALAGAQSELDGDDEFCGGVGMAGGWTMLGPNSGEIDDEVQDAIDEAVTQYLGDFYENVREGAGTRAQNDARAPAAKCECPSPTAPSCPPFLHAGHQPLGALFQCHHHI